MIVGLWSRLRRGWPAPPKTVVLHAGAGKTGTSAIQTWLARNQARLEEHGISYPTPPEGLAAAIEGRITTGNARILSGYALDKGGPSLKAPVFVDWLDGILRHPAGTILLSSELLQKGDEGKLTDMKALFERRGCRVTIVFAVRNVADHLFSGWGQRIKRRGAFLDWDQHCRTRKANFPAVLGRYERVFGSEAVRVVNYERNKGDIVRAILAQVSSVDFGDTRVERVNRSLSARETELMLAFNRATARLSKDAELRAGLAAQLSDFLVYAADLAPSKLTLTASQLAVLTERYGATVDAINRTYLPREPILVADPRSVAEAAPAEELSGEDRTLMRRLAESTVRGELDLRALVSHGDALQAITSAIGDGTDRLRSAGAALQRTRG